MKACMTPAQAATKAMMMIETNPMAAWADECLMIGDDHGDQEYVGMARRLQPNDFKGIPMDAFDREDEWLYASYRGWMLRAGFKDGVSLTRFSSLLVDLCREQLGLSAVCKPPKDAKGNHITGVRFRDLFDQDKPGLVTAAINQTVRLQACEGSMKAVT